MSSTAAEFPVLTVGVLAFLATTALVLALSMPFGLMSRRFGRPYLLLFPLTGAIASISLLKSVKRRNDLLAADLYCSVRHAGLFVWGPT
jgi:hypothetical protein